MNDDDVRFALRMIGIALLVVVVSLVGMLVARGAALLDMAGAKIIVMTADEMLQLIAAKDAEIKRLQDERKKDCGLI